MLNVYLPGRPASPYNSTHLSDSSVPNSHLAAAPAPQLSHVFLSHRNRRNRHIDCSRGIHSLSSNNHHLAAAGHTEWADSESRSSRCTNLLAVAGSKGNPKTPKRQFASDLGVEEQQKGYAESPAQHHPKRSWMPMCMWVWSVISGGTLRSEASVACSLENPPEAGILPEALVSALDTSVEEESRAERRATSAAASTSGSSSAAFATNGGILFHPTEQSQIKESWKHLMRWSRAWRTVEDGTGVLKDIEKVSSHGLWDM